MDFKNTFLHVQDRDPLSSIEHHVSPSGDLFGIQVHALQPLPLDKVISAYRSAERRLLLFDYDGTLTPIVNDPAAAILPGTLVDSLDLLASHTKNNLWIISGRDQTFLEKSLTDVSDVGLSAEHGSFIRYPLKFDWRDLTTNVDMGWREKTMKVFRAFEAATPGSFVEVKKVAMVWHYRDAEQGFGALQALQCIDHLKQSVTTKWAVEVMRGKCVVEVRPLFANKGRIVEMLLKEPHAIPPENHGFVLCMGDDRTDEDMFAILKRAGLAPTTFFCVKVGSSIDETWADYSLDSPAEVLALIWALHDADEEENIKEPSSPCHFKAIKRKFQEVDDQEAIKIKSMMNRSQARNVDLEQMRGTISVSSSPINARSAPVTAGDTSPTAVEQLRVHDTLTSSAPDAESAHDSESRVHGYHDSPIPISDVDDNSPNHDPQNHDKRPENHEHQEDDRTRFMHSDRYIDPAQQGTNSRAASNQEVCNSTLPH